MPKIPILKKLAEHRARLKARADKSKGKGVALLPREPETATGESPTFIFTEQQEQADAKTSKDV